MSYNGSRLLGQPCISTAASGPDWCPIMLAARLPQEHGLEDWSRQTVRLSISIIGGKELED